MALPTFQAVGSVDAAGASAVNPAWPTHQAGDIGLLVVESQGVVTMSDAQGFVEVTNSGQQTTNSSVTRLTVYWARATSSSMSAPSLSSANHTVAAIATFRGCEDFGNPWETTSGTINDTASLVCTFPEVTTTLDDCLIVLCAARGDDTNIPSFSNFVNASLANLTERQDAGTATGNGGGFAIATGELGTAGASGTTTADLAASVTTAVLTIALKAEDGIPAPSNTGISWESIQNVESTLRSKAGQAHQVSAEKRNSENPVIPHIFR
jgi:MSHA biogenesis protein MshQ